MEVRMNAATRVIEFERQGDTLVLVPQGDLRELDSLEFGEDPEEVLWLLAADPSLRNVVVDFRNTDHFSTTAGGLLAQLRRQVRGRNGRIALCNLSAHEEDIQAVTGLVPTWSIYPSRAEALAAVRL
jgi:anti-anti-sigma factor